MQGEVMGVGKESAVASLMVALLAAVAPWGAPVGVVIGSGPQAVARGGESPFDFNGDGHADLAVGAPGEAIGAKREAGSVNVIYGSAAGPTTAGDQLWSQRTRGVAGAAEPGDEFGSAMASGDFDADGNADLAVGIPGESFGAKSDAGAVEVIYGSAKGLRATRSRVWHQGSPGVPGSNQANDRFGETVAVGDFDGDGFDDLAIGVPGERIAGLHWAGRVVVVRGSASGLTPRGVKSWSQATPGVDDDPELADQFGAALAVGDFDGDGRADLAVCGDLPEGGAVNVLLGSATGLAGGSQFLAGAAMGIRSGLPLPAMTVGLSRITSADFNADGHGDLAVAELGTIDPHSPTPWIGGTVAVLYGQAGGFRPGAAQLWRLDREDLPGQSRWDDRFGVALAAGDFTADGVPDLAIGSYYPSLAGSVYVLRGSSAGLAAIDPVITQESPGIQDDAASDVMVGDMFGGSLAALRLSGGTSDWLAIGARWEGIGTVSHGAGSVWVVPASTTGPDTTASQEWDQDTPGVRGIAEDSDLFGTLGGGIRIR